MLARPPLTGDLLMYFFNEDAAPLFRTRARRFLKMIVKAYFDIHLDARLRRLRKLYRIGHHLARMLHLPRAPMDAALYGL